MVDIHIAATDLMWAACIECIESNFRNGQFVFKVSLRNIPGIVLPMLTVAKRRCMSLQRFLKVKHAITLKYVEYDNMNVKVTKLDFRHFDTLLWKKNLVRINNGSACILSECVGDVPPPEQSCLREVSPLSKDTYVFVTGWNATQCGCKWYSSGSKTQGCYARPKGLQEIFLGLQRNFHNGGNLLNTVIPGEWHDACG